MSGSTGANPLVFYNSLSTSERRIVLDCTVQRIHHCEFGAISHIKTEGLEYLIEAQHDTIIVDAEERAGEVVSEGLQPTGWLFTVKLDVHSIVGMK